MQTTSFPIGQHCLVAETGVDDFGDPVTVTRWIPDKPATLSPSEQSQLAHVMRTISRMPGYRAEVAP